MASIPGQTDVQNVQCFAAARDEGNNDGDNWDSKTHANHLYLAPIRSSL